MPRKYFRKFLPTHQNILDNRYIALFGSRLSHHNLWHLHRRSVAGGVAVGMSCGVIPAPFHYLCTVLCAISFRVNLPVALLTSLYRNPITVLPLYISGFYLGNLIMRSAGAAPITMPPAFSLTHFVDWLGALAVWALGLGPSLVVGLVVLGAALGAAGYVCARTAWRIMVIRAWRQRALRNSARGLEPHA
jgi:uncharacterized protein (DUF2062 family)